MAINCSINSSQTTNYSETQSAKPDSLNYYKNTVYSHLSQAQDDIQHGRIYSADSVFADILDELEKRDA